MKIILSKSQWELIGQKTGWIKTARSYSKEEFEERVERGDFVFVGETSNGLVYMDEVMDSRLLVNFEVHFNYKNDPGAGFSFPCNEDGKVLTGKISGGAKNNIKFINKNMDKFLPPTFDVFVQSDRLCDCGSGLPSEEQYDARGIFLTYTCPKCEKSKLSKYRPEVLENSNYESDEAIEAD